MVVATASPASSASPSAPTTLWQATMQTDSEFNIENPSALICHTQYKFVLDLSVGSAGTVKGSGTADLMDVPACPRKYDVVIVEKISFLVTGVKGKDGFTLTVEETGDFEPAGSIDLTGMLVSLSGDATSGTFTVTAPFTDASGELASNNFPRTTTAGSGIYTTENALVVAQQTTTQ
jgi:hypothetical protein